MTSIENIMPPFDNSKMGVVLKYLRQCGISEPTIQFLLINDLIRADKDGDPVFIDRKRNVAEILVPSWRDETEVLTLPRQMQSYHNNKDCYWYLGETGGKIYICTTAIDALCLRELQMEKGINENEIYVSLSGINDELLAKILGTAKECILAVNNDEYSMKIRERFPENKSKNLYHLRPEGINWTEDLLRYKELLKE